jgi:CRP-like cAMP-binding protein
MEVTNYCEEHHLSAGSRKVPAGHYLFRDGDPSDAMYVIKGGKFAVTKSKNTSEIILAELGPGAMVGEMAFFDGRPRSASVKAIKDSEVICLPFKALHAQFQTFPEWCKAVMRTVNDHLREANMRIRMIEKPPGEEDLFPPHTINRIISILNFVALRYGKNETDGCHVPQYTLRNYTIQVFQEPTHKMDKLLQALHDIGLISLENLAEGKQKIVIPNQDQLFDFVEWHNEWLFKQEKDRILIKEEELKILKAVVHFGQKVQPNDKGVVKLSLKTIQDESMRELDFLVKVDDVNSLIEKKLISDKVMEATGIYITFVLADLEKLAPKWDIIYKLKKVTR